MDDKTTSIEISRFRESDASEWNRFLQDSNDGTLFHDLRFLDYHPPGRFQFNHLIAKRERKVIALIPGGLIDDGAGIRFVSPLGASVGGPVTGLRLRLSEATPLVVALQQYAADNGWTGLEMTLPPPIYHRRPSETLSFVLLRQGFRIAKQALSLAVPIALIQGANRFERLFRATSANEVRKARRAGVTIQEGGGELLPQFAPLFDQTYLRLGSKPTHTAAELGDLLQRLPERVRIFTACVNGSAIAAILLFLLNDVAAYSFYHVMNLEHESAHGQKAIFAHVIDRLASANYRWLDLGPSASLHHTNDSVLFFKEGLGGVGQARTTWWWGVST